MCRKIYDAFGLELNVGDFVCFTLPMRMNKKPMVKAKIVDIKMAKKPVEFENRYNDWLVLEYVENNIVEWARLENKLLSRVTPSRVIKCY